MLNVTTNSNLLDVVERDLGPEEKKAGHWHYWKCPFHNENTASFGVTDNGKGYHCFGCGVNGGDAIAYCVERGKITLKEAARLRHSDNGNDNGNGRRSRRETQGKRKESVKPPTKDTTEAPPTAWRDQAAAFVEYCAGKLFEGENPGLEHLHARGLTDDTIRAWGLGWHGKTRRRLAKKWGLDGKLVYLARALTIPWHVEGEVWHVKMRLFEDWGNDTPKYIRVRGGEPILYGLDRLAGKATVVICEGELDAALLWQEAGDLVDVVALGTKTQRLNPKALARLTGATRWWLALDNDADERAGKWEKWSARVRRIRPIDGNDITDFHQAGGDLRAWIKYHLERDAVKLIEAELPTPLAIRRYAEIADALGWPCKGAPWKEWADEVINDTGG